MLLRDNAHVGKIRMTPLAFEDPITRSHIFAYFHPFHAEHDLYRNVIMYTGVCDYFDEIDQGQEVPEYMVEINRHANGPSTIKFVKV